MYAKYAKYSRPRLSVLTVKMTVNSLVSDTLIFLVLVDYRACLQDSQRAENDKKLLTDESASFKGWSVINPPVLQLSHCSMSTNSSSFYWVPTLLS